MPSMRPCISWVTIPGKRPAKRRQKRCAMLPLSCWIYTPSVRPTRAMRSNWTRSSMPPLPTASRLKKPRISLMPLAPCCRICNSRNRWIGWCAVMLALVKPRWRCAPLLWQLTMENRSRYWCRLLCWHSSILKTLKIASLTGRYGLKYCRALSAVKRKKSFWTT